PRRQDGLDTTNAFTEGLIEITIQRTGIQTALVAKGVVQTRAGDAHFVGEIAHRSGLIAAQPKSFDGRIQNGSFIEFARPRHLSKPQSTVKQLVSLSIRRDRLTIPCDRRGSMRRIRLPSIRWQFWSERSITSVDRAQAGPGQNAKKEEPCPLRWCLKRFSLNGRTRRAMQRSTAGACIISMRAKGIRSSC